MKASKIYDEFILLLRKTGDKQNFRLNQVSRNIIELSGNVNCLLYCKIRSESPYRWGVTANRINELKNSGANWYVILLYESPQTGYFLTDENVDRYIKENIWPLGNDGDYKVAKGTYLKYNDPFKSFNEFVSLLEKK